jgi:hypothetical protein
LLNSIVAYNPIPWSRAHLENPDASEKKIHAMVNPNRSHLLTPADAISTCKTQNRVSLLVTVQQTFVTDPLAKSSSARREWR